MTYPGQEPAAGPQQVIARILYLGGFSEAAIRMLPDDIVRGLQEAGFGLLNPEQPRSAVQDVPTSTKTPWQVLINGIHPKTGGCGLVYELAGPMSAAIADMRGLRVSEPHYHIGETEIYIVLAGSGTVVVGGTGHQVSPGSVVVTPPGTAHYTSADGLVLMVLNWPPFDAADYVPLMDSDPDVGYDHARYLHLCGQEPPSTTETPERAEVGSRDDRTSETAPEAPTALRVRHGNHNAETIYRVEPDGSETFIGMARTPELAAWVVQTINGAGVVLDHIRDAIDELELQPADALTVIREWLDGDLEIER